MAAAATTSATDSTRNGGAMAVADSIGVIHGAAERSATEAQSKKNPEADRDCDLLYNDAKYL